MKKEQEQELNKKLAEWVGIRYVKHAVQVCGQLSERYEWHYPDSSFHPYSPDFPHSLDACFKLLVPQAIAELANMDLSTIKEATKKLFQLWVEQEAETHTLALCLVIEKLIDGGKDGKTR